MIDNQTMNKTEVEELADFEIFDSRDTINVVAYSVMTFGKDCKVFLLRLAYIKVMVLIKVCFQWE